MLFRKRGDADKKDRKLDQRKSPAASVPTPPQPETPRPRPVPAAPTPPDLSRSEISVTDLSQMVTSSGRPARGSADAGLLAFGPDQGGRSTDALAAREGDVFRATAHVQLVRPATNDRQSNFSFGPICLDAEGNVLRSWRRFDPPASAPTELAVEVRAPAGTTSVRIGLRGPGSKDGEPADYVVGFSSVRLAKSAGG